MRYLKYFENNEVDIYGMIVSYLESQDIVSIDEMYRNIEVAKNELYEVISYFSDDDISISLLTDNFIIQGYFKDDLKRVSIIPDNIFILFLQELDYKKISDIIEKKFDVVSTSVVRYRGSANKLYVLLNLVSDDVLYYEKYKFVSADKKEGFAFQIKSSFRSLKKDFTESMNFSYEFINECSKKLHHIRKSGNILEFGYDGKTIDIRVS